MRFLVPVSALIALVALPGCSGRSNPAAPVVPPPPAPTTGTLSGWVHLERQCHELERFGGGVVVSLEGTGFATTTDSTGDWRFDDLPFGSYVLSFSRPGYSSFKAFDYRFSRTETARLSWFEGLIEKPTGTVSNMAVDTASVAARKGVRVSFDLASDCPGGTFEALVVLGGSGKTLRPDHYVVTSGVMRSGSNHFELFYESGDLAWHGLAIGSRVFVRAYEARKFGYWNPFEQVWVFTAVAESGGALGSCVVP